MSNASLVNGHIDRPKMTDGEIPKKKIKAYAHITVGGTIDKPCYSIEWYDVEENSMHSGFSSYNLEFVCKWLNEEFEVVEANSNGILEQGFKSGFKAGVKAFAEKFEKRCIDGGIYPAFIRRQLEAVKEEVSTPPSDESDTSPLWEASGKWLINPDGYYPYCSECGAEPEGRKMTKFCPECGTQMTRR